MMVIARFIKRFVVFLPGVFIAYLVAIDIYPVLDANLPVAAAVLLAYLLTAYVLIPAAIRFIRIIEPPKHVPFYSTTPDGFASDPVQIGLYGTRSQVISAMHKIGWHQADKRTPRTIIKMGVSTLLRRPYHTAP